MNSDVTGRSRQKTVVHEYFGEIAFFGFKDMNKSYWECIKQQDGTEFFIAISSPDGLPPSDNHAQFVDKTFLNLDSLFENVTPSIASEFERRVSQEFPSNWRTVALFRGMVLPYSLDGDFNWDLVFEINEELGPIDYICHLKGTTISDITFA